MEQVFFLLFLNFKTVIIIILSLHVLSIIFDSSGSYNDIGEYGAHTRSVLFRGPN